tara:strand:- start:710 stop:1747 length:1038 start_codon:yes stop_codon:yes gene_type:complete
MSVYLGQDGLVQIKRTADASGFIALVRPSDVNTTRNRFSYDYVGDLGGGIAQELINPQQPDTPDNRDEMQYVPLITGDRVRFQRVEKREVTANGKTTIQWVNSTTDQELVEKSNGDYDTDFTAYVNVDGLGGIRLYRTFNDAINFIKSSAYDVQTLSENHYFKVTAGQLDQFRGLGQVRNYEFTTNREQIDITSLGKNFRRYYSNGLLSGQGRLECLWPMDLCRTGKKSGDCDDVRYLTELVLRLEEGAVFSGNFILNCNNNNKRNEDRFLYYECDKCVITSVAVTVDPSSVLRTSINFVTSGPFQLRYSNLPGFLLVEGITRADDLLLQESDDGLEILDDDLLD